MPKGSSFNNIDSALNFYRTLNTNNVMIKPIDSSGSKGVFKCHTEQELLDHWEESLCYSISKEIIIEEFVEKKGYQIDGDIFMENGEIVFWGICDQHHDEGIAPYVPVGLSYPSVQPLFIQEEAKRQIIKILDLLNMRMGAYNIEYIVSPNNDVYILEIGPRNGGNFIADVIKHATGFDMATYSVRQAVGDPCLFPQKNPTIKPTSSYLLHSQCEGNLKSVDFSNEIENHIVEIRMCNNINSKVIAFHNAGATIGYLLLEYADINTFNYVVDNMNRYVKVYVE